MIHFTHPQSIKSKVQGQTGHTVRLSTFQLLTAIDRREIV